METIDFNTVIAENISVVEGLLPVATKTSKGLMPANFYMNMTYSLYSNTVYKIAHVTSYIYQELTFNSYTSGIIGEGRILCARQNVSSGLSVKTVSNNQDRISVAYILNTNKSIDIYISVKGVIINLWPSHPQNTYSLDIDIEEVSSIPDGAVLFEDI